ncbi:MAG: hypothetical protein ACRDGA_13405 [Bacteroidota bacterium]
MGQQQLLIIALATIIVGMAVYGGLRVMEANRQSSERDLIIQQMNALLADAKQYALKPRSLGGGEGSFEGFVPMEIQSNTERVNIFTTVGSDWILFQGFGSVEGSDRENSVQVVAQYSEAQGKWESMTTVN